MTWVVGAVSPFGNAVIISDIRVTFGDGREEDLIQKSYCVGRYMVAGFAGSVRIGFHLLAHLTKRLAVDDPDPDHGWHPNEVARAWGKEAASIFARHSHREQAVGCSILIGGVSPNQNNGDAPWAKTYLMRLAAPNFVPGFARNGIAALQIGSGQRFGEYRDRVRRYFRDPRFASTFGSWGGSEFGNMLATSLGERVEKYPQPGVSSHMHVVVCGRRHLAQGTNDYHVLAPVEREHRMPPVATSYTAFLDLARSKGLHVAQARA